MKRNRRIPLVHNEWALGYQAGITGKAFSPPPGSDGYSFSAGYAEGEAKRHAARKKSANLSLPGQ